ncbi:MAG: hypothetical protein ACR5LG_10395 [Sodalis sp. (in: enterobacteria)]|uniref:hypothetical protein n=1 Tax=Sodalis sp. (in: enterobacteria) TaxID=1898979 RepID=UPI003F38F093
MRRQCVFPPAAGKKEALNSGDDWEVIRSARLLTNGAPEDIARAILTSLMA